MTHLIKRAFVAAHDPQGPRKSPRSLQTGPRSAPWYGADMASKARKTGWDAAVAESEAQGGGELAARPGAAEGRQAWPGDVLGCLEVVDRRLVGAGEHH